MLNVARVPQAGGAAPGTGPAVKAGERVLLPAVRDAPADTLIVTDG